MVNDNQRTFVSQLPQRPYCADEMGYTKIRNKEKALKMLYLQANQPAIQTCMLFDIDEQDCFYKFEDANLPVPHFITKSPGSGRCHYGYILKSGVCKTQQARQAPLRYAAAIESAMSRKLNADPAFAGLLTKNPLNPHWSPFWSNTEPYDLDYLADFVDLTSPNTGTSTRRENYGLGRNVNLFDDLRTYAYKHVLNYKNNKNADAWESEIERQAINLNAVCNPANPLDYKEVKATARSVARWTWKNFTNAIFSEIQSARGKKNKGKKQSNIKDMLEFLGAEK